MGVVSVLMGSEVCANMVIAVNGRIAEPFHLAVWPADLDVFHFLRLSQAKVDGVGVL